MASKTPTRVWLARFYKVDARPLDAPRKKCTCIVLCNKLGNSGVVTYALDNILHKVNYFDSIDLNWEFVGKQGGYHLHVIGRINSDGTVTKCERPINHSSELNLVDFDHMTEAFKEVCAYTENLAWLAEMQKFQDPSPLEEYYELAQ